MENTEKRKIELLFASMKEKPQADQLNLVKKEISDIFISIKQNHPNAELIEDYLIINAPFTRDDLEYYLELTDTLNNIK